jgi:DNA mismatch repair protein MutL
MSDIIRLLPDSVANQIAAGEVIQRPASVIKELVENSIDAGATKIKVVIKDAGRNLIQVIDNGKGMSATDARLSFERHATSKINKAEDLFSIRTMGFRGEALASIAAVAQVELKTRQVNNELGTHIVISGSEIESQEFTTCEVGCNFLVRNLFFNIPARRRFLKSENTEFRHILSQFQRIVLCYPDIAFSLSHNGHEIYQLPVANIHKRIVHVFGKSIEQDLIPLNTQTSIVGLSGFIGKPQFAKKNNLNQFFFVNQRFMRHAYFHKALVDAYENIMSSDLQPSYFIYIDINPEGIDINVHPSKTEIKFEDAPAIFQIIRASTKEALGKFNIVPSIDFDQAGSIDIPVLSKKTVFNTPQIGINPNYNPFDNETSFSGSVNPKHNEYETNNLQNWENLYQGIDFGQNKLHKPIEPDLQLGYADQSNQNHTARGNVLMLKGKYIVTPVKSGLMLINRRRAHERILYEQFMLAIIHQQSVSQVSLFPQTLNLGHDDSALLAEIINDLHVIGFDIREFGNNTFVVNATPAMFENIDPTVLIAHFLEIYKATEVDIKENAREKMALSLAQAAAIDYSSQINEIEMKLLIDNLFMCQSPNYSPSGKIIIQIISFEEIEKKF